VSGHVFHPGHDELHGVTVVVTGASGRTYLGRWHERAARGVTMKDVAIREPDSDVTLDAWLTRQRKFGLDSSEKFLIVPNDEVGAVEKF
jgi:hypothetical protein